MYIYVCMHACMYVYVLYYIILSVSISCITYSSWGSAFRRTGFLAKVPEASYKASCELEASFFQDK